MTTAARDHGGNIDDARARFGGDDWLDLSTGINRVPYPLPPIPDAAWTTLPTRAAIAELEAAARIAYRTRAPLVALPGAQAAIQLIPRLDASPGRARVLSPTYNEHAAALRTGGWQVSEVSALADLAGADLAVVVNPNNPDGRCHDPDALLRLAGDVGRLVVDESFADPRPAMSLAPHAGRHGLLVLRSFGKFYGLAGVRLGFAIGAPAEVAGLAEMAGPWAVSGAAIAIGRAALSDPAWSETAVARLRADVVRLDRIAAGTGWSCVGGTELFRLYATPSAAAAQDRLARHRIWTRTFPYSERWLRLGVPGPPDEWHRLAAALENRE